MENREKGRDLSLPSFYDYTTGYSKVRSKLKIPEDKKITAVFTTSEFEVIDSEDLKDISIQLDLIANLIEIFRKRDDYLIIRHHPFIFGHMGYHSHPPDVDFISKAYEQAFNAPENIRFIMPYEELNSYALYWNIDSAITFTSSVGFEATSRAIPSASLSASPFYQSLYRTISPETNNIKDLKKLLKSSWTTEKNSGKTIFENAIAS